MVTPFSSQRRLVRARSSRSASGQLPPVVDALASRRGRRRPRADRVAHAGEHADDVGEVVLALGVVGGEPAQRRAEQVAAEAVDAGVDLVDGAARRRWRRAARRCARTVAVAAAHDPAVAGRVGHRAASRTWPRCRWRRAASTSASRVSGRSSGVSPGSTTTVDVVVEVVVGQRGQADDHGVAGAALDVLLDEGDVAEPGPAPGRLAWSPARRRGRRPRRCARRRSSASGVEHVQHHRPTADQVQRLGPVGAHPGALAGGEDDGRDGHVACSIAAWPALHGRSPATWRAAPGRGARTPIHGTKIRCPAC